MPTFVSAAARKLLTARPLRKVTSATVVEPDALLAEIGTSRKRDEYVAVLRDVADKVFAPGA